MAKRNKYNIDDEIIIGYNTKNKKNQPPKKKDKKGKSKKKKKKGKIRKILKTILKIILILAVITGVIIFLFVSPVFNITQINVNNAEKISESVYIALSEIEIGENIFQINKSKIIENIKTESYVESVEVTRVYPGTVEITVTERETAYLIESNSRYIYIDKNGYILETSISKLDLPILKGISSDLENITLGDRLEEEDLAKFNDIIKIIDAINNNGIEETLSYIDISDDDNYILGFEEEGKTAELGDTSDLSTKMLWIKYFLEQKQDETGTIYLNSENIYFSPAN